ncbi:hypothetical protein HH308_10340 [Gordonia sp. TBRC 11910]|uniref:Uncharacterized protein n=1 Tax=Gordonia asplenii TaxID=2725283 RepID=A0A848KT28_9ACTN|nr:hypothetical protein [Gordonia asplenii]NMO01610.1 hypothetical protein [Gordonia asplenii]
MSKQSFVAKAALVGAGAGMAVALSTGVAHATGTKSLMLATPGANTVVATIANSDMDDSVSCTVWGQGPTYWQAPLSVAPRNSKSVRVVDVPAGNYTIGWDCNGFAQEKHYITVGGTGTPSAKPHTVS